MKTVTLDLTNIHTPAAAQIYVQYMLDFPAYYGRNLDALHDMLCEIGEETHIVLRMPSKPVEEMERYLPKLIRVFEDSAKESRMLTFEK